MGGIVNSRSLEGSCSIITREVFRAQYLVALICFAFNL